MPRGKIYAQPATLLVPSEYCYARDGLLISFLTPADHRGVKPNGEEVYRYGYRAAVAWMEWFGHDLIQGVIIGRDSIRMYWVDAHDTVAADWREGYLPRPSIGLIQEPWSLLKLFMEKAVSRERLAGRFLTPRTMRDFRGTQNLSQGHT